MDKIIHYKKDCISCGACAAIAPEYWYLDEQGLAQLKESKEVADHFEREPVSEQELVAHEEASGVCPVNIIHIEKKGKG